MSHVDNAVRRIRQANKKRLDETKPSRAIVTGTNGNLTTIQRLNATTGDAEPYAKATGDTFVAGDEVLCLPVNGKPVMIGKVRR